ncbi:MAG: DUF2085 domain-containing protein [Chloroflexota bacterium]
MQKVLSILPSFNRTRWRWQGQWLSHRWLLLLNLAFGLYVGLPFLAPIFMHIGWNGAGKVIYSLYSWLCHQLPQRSFFLFGDKFTYSLAEVQNAWQNTTDLLLLRQFIGTPEMGWKVAWSDRMVSMFVSTWLSGLLWWPIRRRLPALPLWGLGLFLLPMAVDGTTHFFSDLAGIGQGFRDDNAWLAALSAHVFPASFSAGDAWGSFNSWMRLLTGVLFGLGAVWFGYPYLDDAFSAQPIRYASPASSPSANKASSDEEVFR